MIFIGLFWKYLLYILNCDNDIDIENTNNDFYCCGCVLMKTMLNSDESIIVIKQTNQMKLASGT